MSYEQVVNWIANIIKYDFFKHIKNDIQMYIKMIYICISFCFGLFLNK